jgi:hypothetical protein
MMGRTLGALPAAAVMTFATACAGGGASAASSAPPATTPTVTGTIAEASGGDFKAIRIGMTERRVRALAGPPSRLFPAGSRPGEGRCWVYDEAHARVGVVCFRHHAARFTAGPGPLFVDLDRIRAAMRRHG